MSATGDGPEGLLDAVRTAGRGRAAAGARARAAAGLRGRWKEAERAVADVILRSPEAGARDVRAFERVAAESGSREAAGRAARLRGTLLAYRGEYRASLTPYRRAEELLRGPARDGARLGRASSLLRLGGFDEARKVARAVRSAASRRRDGAIVAGALLSEAIALHEGGRPERALAPYARAREAFENGGQTYMAAVAAQDEGNALLLLDRFDEAADRFANSAAALRGLGLTREALRWEYNRGALLVATDRLGEADEVLAGVEQAFRDAGDALHAALARLDRGEALLRAGLVPEALHALETARRGLLRRAPPTERERATQLLARARIAAGDPAGARRLLRSRAATAARRDLAARTEIVGRALAAEGRFGLAAERLLTAAREYGRTAPAAACRARTAAAWCAHRAGDDSGARRACRGAGAIARRLRLPTLLHGVAAVRFLIEERAGRRAAADAALAEALEMLEQVRAGRGPDAMRAAVLAGREAWFARAVRHVLAGPRGAEGALELLERWRARALRDLMADADLIVPRDEAVTRLRARVAALERRLDAGREPAFLRAAGGAAASRAEDRLREAEAALRGAVERALPADFHKPPSVASVQRSLDRGTFVLSSFADDDGGLLFGVDRDGVTVVPMAWTRSSLADGVDDLHFRLEQFTVGADFSERHARRFRRATDAALARIAAAILEPFAERLRCARRLVVVPHGPLHRVPFAALPLDGSPLAASLPISLAPGLGALETPGRRARGVPLVIGYGDADAPAIEDEAHAVAVAVPRARLLVGEAARGDRLLGRRAAPRCVHIAAHGRYRDDAPAMSGVRLADGWLRAADLRLAPLRGSVVVLSGCETGVTRVSGADEVHGMVRGALAAGAAEVVASHWRVDDPATCRLMARFHSLRGASGAAVALAQAQAELAEEGLHPWFWGGFAAWTASAWRA